MAESGPGVGLVQGDPADRDTPEQGTALCLSGGGFRAMLFHVGALWRLNELGWLPRLKRISSVSGGSITSALLGLRWHALGFGASGTATQFGTQIVEPLRAFAKETVDVWSVVIGLPKDTVVDRYKSPDRVILRTDANRENNKDHIICGRMEGEVNCNYADVLNQ